MIDQLTSTQMKLGQVFPRHEESAIRRWPPLESLHQNHVVLARPLVQRRRAIAVQDETSDARAPLEILHGVEGSSRGWVSHAEGVGGGGEEEGYR